MPVTFGQLNALLAGGSRTPLTTEQRDKILTALKASINPVDGNGNTRNATMDDVGNYLYDFIVANTLGHLKQIAGDGVTF